jgi:hypothetical protein
MLNGVKSVRIDPSAFDSFPITKGEIIFEASQMQICGSVLKAQGLKIIILVTVYL